MDPFNWKCPHCQHAVTISESRYSAQTHFIPISEEKGAMVCLLSQFIRCPNLDCGKFTLSAFLHRATYNPHGADRIGDLLETWDLVPPSNARPFPDYVPVPIRTDYKEACLIRHLSPKASATLSRRCVQGILRDFYRIKPGRLVDEIRQLEDTMEPELWQAIDGLRKVGNIGAHMEADINVIVDVDPNEAQLLIGLVETMIEETYIARVLRSERLAKVKALAESKKGGGGPATPAKAT